MESFRCWALAGVNVFLSFQNATSIIPFAGVHRNSQNCGRCHHRVDPDISTGAGCISAFFVVFLGDVLEFLFIVDIPIHDELDASTNAKLLSIWCVPEHQQGMEKTIPITWSSKIEANIAEEKKDNIFKMTLGVVHIWRHISLANFRPPLSHFVTKTKNPQIWRHKPLILPPPSPQEGYYLLWIANYWQCVIYYETTISAEVWWFVWIWYTKIIIVDVCN